MKKGEIFLWLFSTMFFTPSWNTVRPPMPEPIRMPAFVLSSFCTPHAGVGPQRFQIGGAASRVICQVSLGQALMPWFSVRQARLLQHAQACWRQP